MFLVLTRTTRQLPVISLISGIALLLTATWAQAVGPVVVDPVYTLTTFTGVPPGTATQPDDLAISADGKDLWVGYGNGVGQKLLRVSILWPVIRRIRRGQG